VAPVLCRLFYGTRLDCCHTYLPDWESLYRLALLFTSNTAEYWRELLFIRVNSLSAMNILLPSMIAIPYKNWPLLLVE